MKKTFTKELYIAAAVIIAGCAKTVTPGPNEANKRYFDAWMELNYPDVEPSGLGIYVLSETEGNGAEVSDSGFVLVDYRITSLEGTISAYTDAQTAKQLGEYNKTNYYGPKFWTTYQTTIQAGLGDALKGMKAGGYKKVIVPSWLMTAKAFDTAQDYLDYYDEDESAAYSSTIYEFEVKDYTEDIDQWQVDSIGRFFRNKNIMIDGKPADQVFEGMTSVDTTVYINYTGKLLNGLVFDTSIERVAKDNGLYSSSRTYGPVEIHWGETYSEITMGSDKSTVIGGFALTLWQMRAMEKGVGVFYSNLGYQYSGSGSGIPGYAPLIFEIELVEKPEE